MAADEHDSLPLCGWIYRFDQCRFAVWAPHRTEGISNLLEWPAHGGKVLSAGVQFLVINRRDLQHEPPAAWAKDIGGLLAQMRLAKLNDQM
ncbi:hypothetical protein D3C78_1423450 [compost metagenome]